MGRERSGVEPGATKRRAVSAASPEGACPRANPAVLYRELRTGCLLYHPGTNEAHALNLTAAYVWTCCDGGMDVPGIAASLAEACRIPVHEALRDVKTVLKEFHAKKLLL